MCKQNGMVPRSRWATLTCLKPNSNNLLNAIHELPVLCELSVPYVGHFLLPPKLFLNLNQRGRQALSAGLHPATELGREMFTFLHVFPFHVLIHKILFGQTHIQLWLNETGERAKRLALRANFCLCPVPRSVEYPSWDWRESRDFDELNHILQESKKLGKALESLSRSEWTQTPWATNRNKLQTFSANETGSSS